jgi:hypothetical protein
VSIQFNSKEYITCARVIWDSARPRGALKACVLLIIIMKLYQYNDKLSPEYGSGSKSLVCLFIYGLFNDTVSSSDFIASNGKMINKLVGIRKEASPNLRYYYGICLEGLRKITNISTQDYQSPGQHLTPGFPEYEAGVLTIQP